MAKPLRHITGVKSSKVETMDLKDLNQWNAPDGDKFVAKHKIEKHADRVGNGDDVYKGKTKKADYKRQESGVYEEVEQVEEAEKWIQKAIKKPGALHKQLGVPEDKKIPAGKLASAAEKGGKLGQRARLAQTLKKLKEDRSCNHSSKGTHCEMHGMNECPPDNDEYKRESKKGKKLLLDKKKVNEAIINEVSPPSKEAEDWIKANKQRFIKEYGKKKGLEVLYATAWKKHGQSESGSAATQTDYAGPGAAGWTTGRMDVGTL